MDKFDIELVPTLVLVGMVLIIMLAGIGIGFLLGTFYERNKDV